MTALEIARVYTGLARTAWEIPEEEHQAMEKIHALRTECHEILMKKMKEERVYFAVRFAAAARALDLFREEEAEYGK